MKTYNDGTPVMGQGNAGSYTDQRVGDIAARVAQAENNDSPASQLFGSAASSIREHEGYTAIHVEAYFLKALE